MNDYSTFYANLSRSIRQSPVKLALVTWCNALITKVMYILYPILLIFILWKEGLEEVLPYILIPGFSFLLVTLIRKFVNQDRPYERWDIEPLIAKDTVGQSMPSRHVFSATMIAMCFLSINLWVGIVLLFLSGLLAVCRVLGGMHYPKDVLVGFAIGLVCGGILYSIL